MSLTTKTVLTLATGVCVLGLVVCGSDWLFGSNSTDRATEGGLDSSVSRNRRCPVESAIGGPSVCLVGNTSTAETAQAGSLAEAQPKTATRDVNDSDDGVSWDFVARNSATKKIEVSLSNPTEINFTDSPLADVVAYLSEYHEIPILLDKVALIDAGIALDTPITCTLAETTLESALNIMLRPLMFEFVITNEVMMITTAERAEDLIEPRVYDLLRLPSLDTKMVSSIILSATRSDSWNENGGAGSLVTGPDFLVINHNQRTHRQIVSLLDQLERQARQKAKRNAAAK